MTQPATLETVQARFDGQVLHTDQENFVVKYENGAYWSLVSPRPSGSKNESPGGETLRVKIDMITGSHHMQVFWVDGRAGNMQLGFPFTWLNEDKRWVPRGDTFLRDPAAPPPKDLWNMTCLRCHTTAGQPRPNKPERKYDSRVAELGIACEACHGPGEAHVSANQSILRRFRLHLTGRGDAATTVQPERLDHVRSSQICGHCHSMKWFDATGSWLQQGFAFLPGQDLEKETPVIRPGKLPASPALRRILDQHPEYITDFFWPDGMIRVSGREFNGLIESPCYQNGAMGCLSCHSMHESNPAAQLAQGMDGNQACLQCHQSMRDSVPAHTHHPAGSSGGLCYNCHMPHTTYGLLRAIRSHQIDSPNIEANLKTGRPNACNLCHLDRTLDWTSKRLAEWFGQKPAKLSPEQRSVSAAVLWAMKGDAGQRVLAAWTMGWKPAHEASGEGWLAPYLARLLNDPYAAVRHAAQRSLKSLPGFADFDFDFVGPENERAKAPGRALKLWKSLPAPAPSKKEPATLMNQDGSWREDVVDQLQADRDNRPVRLRE